MNNSEWIKNLPDSWEIKPIGELFVERKEKNTDGLEKRILSLTIEQGVIPYEEKKTGGNKAKENLEDYKIAKKNDIIMNSMNVVVGAVGKSEYDGAISPAYYVLTPRNKDLCVDYFVNVFLCSTFQDILQGYGNGIMEKKSEKSGKLNTIRMKIPMIKLKQIKVPVPPLKTQKRIATILEKKKLLISNLIEYNSKSIMLLKEYKRTYITNMVLGKENHNDKYDSGIPYIGYIPYNWKILKGKYVYHIENKKVMDNDEVITCFRDGEVTLRKNRREDGYTFSDKEIGYQGIDNGDLVVHGMDGFAGAIGISDSRGKGSPVLNILSTKENKKYIMYYLRSLAYNDVFSSLSTGIRIRSCDLNWNKLKEENIVIPPLDEQDSIVKKIDRKIVKINEIIESKINTNLCLMDYKKSLIFELTIGKIGV